jgi:hypothetical protein
MKGRGRMAASNVDPDSPAGADVGADDLRASALETVYERTLKPVCDAFDGSLLVAASCVASLTYTANLEVNWAIITLAGAVFLWVAAADLLAKSRAHKIHERDGISQSLYASIALFVISLPFITYLATLVAERHMGDYSGTCFWIVGCLHPTHWIYWCYFSAGLLQSAGAVLALKLLARRNLVLHGQSTTRRILLSLILVAGIGGAATDVAAIGPYESLKKLEYETFLFERPANMSKWTTLCCGFWLIVYGSLIREFVRGWKRAARRAP